MMVELKLTTGVNKMSQKKILCRNCKNVKPEDHVFKIEVFDCGDCIHNGAWNELDNEYIYDEKTIDFLGIDRVESYEEGCCEMGECADGGCYMFTCHQCGYQTNLYLVEE